MVLRSILLLALPAAGAAACTALLGDFESTGSAAGPGGGDPTSTSSNGGGGDGAGGGTSCPAGFSDCFGNGDCRELATDPEHCGVCFRNCLGGTCAAGACGIATLVTVGANANPFYVTADSQNVYWTNEGDLSASTGAITKVALQAGATPTVLAMNQPAPFFIAVHDGYVYWTNRNDSTVMRVAAAGGAASEISGSEGTPTGIAISAAGDIYWTSQDNNTVRKKPVGMSILDLATNQNEPYGIALDASHVFWANRVGGTIMRSSHAGSTPEELASGQTNLRNLAVDDTYVYWCAGFSGGFIWRTPKDVSGMPQSIASANTPLGIAVDATSVYWTDAGLNTVNVVPKAGGTSQLLSEESSIPRGIFADADRVIWVTDDAVKVLVK